MASVQNFFSNIRLASIKSKLFIIAANITLVMLLLGLLTNFYINRITAFTQITIPINLLIDNVNNIQKAQKDFLIQDANSDEFLTRGTTKNIERSGRYFSESFIYVEDILSDLTEYEIDDTVLLMNMSRIKTKLSDYQVVFNSLLRKIEKRGSTLYGIVGEWNKLENNTKNRIEIYDNLQLHDMFQDLQLLKSLYLLHKKTKYAGDIVKLSERYSEMLKDTANLLNTNITQGELLLIAHDFEEFSDYTNQVLNLDSEIGFTNDKGLIQEMYQQSNSLETNIFSILRYVEQVSQQERSKAKRTLIIFIIVISIVTISAFAFLSRTIIKPIHKIEAYVKRLTAGELPNKIKYNNQDEIGDMLNALNTFVDSLQHKANAANEIERGNLQVEFKLLSDKDVLGQSLKKMQKSLVAARNEEKKRKKEEDKRKWTSEGLALFADIMRKDNDNIEKLGKNIISNLVKYINANQGALFLINDNNSEDEFIELITAYAYDRHRNMEKRIEIGEGLIGRCIDERQKIYMTMVPQGYISITSGLGDETPDALLIVPLKDNENIFGALEIAGFNQFEEHVIDFVENIAEDIASVISSAKINQRTARLLEQTKHQAEEMAAQEEELRQNLEELETTQEESARKEAEMDSLMASIDASTYAIECDQNGRILKVNQIVVNTHKRNEEHLIGSALTDYIADEEQEDIERALADANKGITIQRTTQKKAGQDIIWMRETYSPILDNNQRVERILNIAFDITEMKELEEKLRRDNERIKSQEEVLRGAMDRLQRQEIEIKNKDKKQ